VRGSVRRKRGVKVRRTRVKNASRCSVAAGGNGELGLVGSPRRSWSVMPAPFGLPIGFTLLLCVGATAAALNGRLGLTGVAIACGVVVLAVSMVSEPLTAAPLGVVAWMTVTAFARAPFATLRPWGHAAVVAAAVIGPCAALGAVSGIAAQGVERSANGATLIGVTGISRFTGAVDARRRIYGGALGAVLLPGLTVLLTGHPLRLDLSDNLLVYLIAVVAVTVIGGFWPAVVSAVAASLLLNWFFTEPYHTFTIAKPDNLLALLLFVVVAVSVSSIVHLAARRSQQAAHSRAEAEALLTLARAVLYGDDTPASVLDHLHAILGAGIELRERSGSAWARIASSGDVESPTTTSVQVRDDLSVIAHGVISDQDRRLLEAGAGQAVAALDRDRLRTQAAQAEALAAGNRMRTALLAAVSHDLRTPLASIKASVSSLRQTDVQYSPDDRAALLETVEESTDRLDTLIANLLDMTRLHTGALQPYLHPTGIDEVAPLAVRNVPGGARVRLDVPDVLPLVHTDAGLLERALANLLANALRYSPDDRPPELSACVEDGRVRVAVVDHGPGVPSDQRERMFEPFQRLGDQDMTTGVGLGLAVARGFIESLGGQISVSDTPGGGLTMTISLPVVAARTSSPAPSQP
jgi:two-component system sensor histidine kinase KdpD